MKDIDYLRQRLKEDGEFKELFTNVKNLDEALTIAREYGFNVTEEEISDDQTLTDEVLEAVAGGKNEKKENITNIINYYVD